MSGMMSLSERSLAPAAPGERTSGGLSPEGIPTSLSSNSLHRVLAGLIAALALFVSVASASPLPAEPPASDALSRALEGLFEPLREACGCESLRVTWRLNDALRTEAAGADSLSATVSADRRRDHDHPSARVRVWRNGRVREVMVAGAALCSGLAWITKRPVRAGSVIAPADVDSLRGWFAPSVVSTREQTPFGAWTGQSLPRGKAISLDRLQEAPLVRAGAEVRLVCLTGALRLEGRGTSRANARLGEVVEVRLEGGRRDCHGVVSGPSEVTVSLERSEP